MYPIIIPSDLFIYLIFFPVITYHFDYGNFKEKEIKKKENFSISNR